MAERERSRSRFARNTSSRFGFSPSVMTNSVITLRARISTRTDVLADYRVMKGESMTAMGAFGNLLSEAGFFETDLSFFHIGRKAAGLQALFGFGHLLCGPFDVDV